MNDLNIRKKHVVGLAKIWTTWEQRKEEIRKGKPALIAQIGTKSSPLPQYCVFLNGLDDSTFASLTLEDANGVIYADKIVTCGTAKETCKGMIEAAEEWINLKSPLEEDENGEYMCCNNESCAMFGTPIDINIDVDVCYFDGNNYICAYCGSYLEEENELEDETDPDMPTDDFFDEFHLVAIINDLLDKVLKLEKKSEKANDFGKYLKEQLGITAEEYDTFRSY